VSRPYIADILAVLKILGSTAAALSLVLYLIRRTRAPFTQEASKSLMNWMAGDKLLWVDPQGKEGYCRESFFFLCSFTSKHHPPEGSKP